jgi:hypothetical protein
MADPSPADLRTEIELLKQSVATLGTGVDRIATAVTALDAKLDAMRDTYVTTTEFGRWKKEDYQPHKEATTAQFKAQGERLNRWLGMVIGAILTASLTLTVYLIVNTAAQSGTRP